MIYFKSTVKIKNLQPQILLAITLADQVFDGFGYPTWITSVNDSTHSTYSLHPKGYAVDLRSKHITGQTTRGIIFDALFKILDPLGYDILFEFIGQDNEHYHIEYDPK